MILWGLRHGFLISICPWSNPFSSKILDQTVARVERPVWSKFWCSCRLSASEHQLIRWGLLTSTVGCVFCLYVATTDYSLPRRFPTKPVSAFVFSAPLCFVQVVRFVTIKLIRGFTQRAFSLLASSSGLVWPSLIDLMLLLSPTEFISATRVSGVSPHIHSVLHSC